MKVEFLFHIMHNLIALTYLVRCKSNAKTFAGSPCHAFCALYINYALCITTDKQNVHQTNAYATNENIRQLNCELVYFEISDG